MAIVVKLVRKKERGKNTRLSLAPPFAHPTISSPFHDIPNTHLHPNTRSTNTGSTTPTTPTPAIERRTHSRFQFPA